MPNLLGDHIPNRFGYFYVDRNDNEVKGLSIKEQDSPSPEVYKARYDSYLEQYKNSNIPFGLDLRCAGGKKAIGMVMDVDRHIGSGQVKTKDELFEVFERVKQVVSKFNYKAEYSPHGAGGVKIWILFDQYIHMDRLNPYLKYIEKKFEGMHVEAYPRKNNWIRLPGVYKDLTTYSIDLDTNEQLDTFEKVESFLNNTINSSTEVLEFFKSIGLDLEQKFERPKEKNLMIKGGISSGMDKYFELIWQGVTGQEMPEPDKVFKCPFHEDTSPSAIIYHSDNKLTFSCNSSNCEVNRAKDVTTVRDALDLLIFRMNDYKGEIKPTIDNRKKAAKFLKYQLILPLFNDYLYTKDSDMDINLMLLAEAIVKEMDKEDCWAVRRDHHRNLYLFDPTASCAIWNLVSQTKCEKDIVYKLTERITERLVTIYGVWHLGIHRLRELASLVDTQLNQPGYFIEPQLRTWYIPYKNGKLNIREKLEGREPTLEPIKKGDYLTRTMDCYYDPSKTNEKFKDTLHTYLPDETDRELFMQYIGSSMVTAMPPIELLFMEGGGGNGKGTILNVLKEVFGKDSHSNVPLDKIGTKFENFGLYGSPLNIDADASMAYSTQQTIEFVKKLTGEDTIPVQRKFGDVIEFRPFCKMVVSCNALPSLGVVNNAIVRRFLSVEFKVSVPVKKYGGFWEELIGGEDGKSGINNMLLEYLYQYIANDRQFPQTEYMKEKAEEFFSETDPVYSYVLSLFQDEYNLLGHDNERLENNVLELGVKSKELFTDFNLYCQQSKRTKSAEIRSLNDTTFGKDLTRKIKDRLFPTDNGADMNNFIRKVRKSSGYVYKFDITGYRKQIGFFDDESEDKKNARGIHEGTVLDDM